jgi:niacin transporter
MKKETKLQVLITEALLCAIGIAIPMFCPKLVIGPASFTLASHVPVFLAMFISPAAAVTVSLGTTLGFLVAGFHPVVVLRALSHLVFALLGALWLRKSPKTLTTVKGATLFSLVISVLHAACELVIVTFFFFGNQLSAETYQSGYFISVILLVGLGGIIHSMVDFSIALAVWKPVVHTVRFPVSVKHIFRKAEQA